LFKEDGGLGLSKDVVILDVACGTGMFGRLLHNQGYFNMVGSYATSNFVRVAKQTGIYSNVFEHWFGTGLDKFPAEHKGRYDVVTAAGCLSKGHIPKEGLDDIHAALKIGGYFVAGWRTYYLTPGEENGFYEKLGAFTQEGKFTLVSSYEL